MQNEPPKEHRFRPGQSGNPAGRPKGSVSIRKRLQRLVDNDPELATTIVQRYIDIALGNGSDRLKALTEITDIIDGPLSHKVEAEVNAKGITINIIKDEAGSQGEGDDGDQL